MTPRHKYRTALIVVMILAAALRLYHFDWGLCEKGACHPSFADDEREIMEMITPIQGQGKPLSQVTPHYPQLGVWLLKVPLKIAAVTGFISPYDQYQKPLASCSEMRRMVLLSRFVVFLTSMILIYLTFFVGARMFGDPVGLLAAAWMAVLPGTVLDGREIRFHALLALFLTLGLLYAWQAAKSDQKESYFKVSAAIGLAASSLYIGIVAAVIPFIAKLLKDPASGWKNKARALFSKKLLAGYGLLFTVAAFFYLIGFSSVEQFVGTLRMSLYRPGFEKFFVDSLTEGPAYFFYSYLPYAFGPFFMVLLGVGVYLVFREKSRRLILTGCFALSMMLLQLAFLSNRLILHHSTWYAPFLCLLAAFGAVTLFKEGGRTKKAIVGLVAGASLVTCFAFSFQMVRWQSETWPQDTASRWLSLRLGPADPVVAKDDYKELYPFILSPQNYLENYRRWTPIKAVWDDYDRLTNLGARFFVTTDWELYGLRNKYLKRPDRYERPYDFVSRLETQGKYRLEKQFSKQPPWPKWLFGSDFAPRDLMQFKMKVMIFQKADMEPLI